MSFARSGRVRFFVCLGILVFVFGMVCLWNSSQQQLEEQQRQNVHCEQQQEALNERLQSMVEQQFTLEKNSEHERKEHMEVRRNFEQKLKELTEKYAKDQMDARVQYEKLEESHKTTKNKHDALLAECEKAKQKHLVDSRALEQKLQSASAELDKEKHVLANELAVWKEKYDTILQEKERLELLLNAADSRTQLQKRIQDLENTVSEYESYCKKPKDSAPQQQPQIGKPPNGTHTTRDGSAQQHAFDKPRSQKSFSGQEIIVQKSIKKLSEETETQLKQQPAETKLAVGGDRVVAPLAAPRKPTSTEATKLEQNALDAKAHLKQASNSSSTSSTSLPPLVMPPNQQRKLPDNVAPIPELVVNEADSQQKPNEQKAENVGDTPAGADIDAAVEEMPKNDDDGKNNRYANAVNDMDQKKTLGAASAAASAAAAAAAAAVNEDSGAHEIKDHDFINDQNFNIPAGEDANFFDGDKPMDTGGDDTDKRNKMEDNEDEDMIAGGIGPAGGDIAVKNHNMLDAENLNNEVAGDQGKEFPDGLRIEDGNDEDEDEDDYSNLAVRLLGAQAIRH